MRCRLIACVQRGLDVYCEKPLLYDIREGRAMVDVVAKSSRIVQVGWALQAKYGVSGGAKIASTPDVFGRVVQAEAQINFAAGLLSPAPVAPPPSLDWDMWCGPGPLIPFSLQVGHKNWRLEGAERRSLFDCGGCRFDRCGAHDPRREIAQGDQRDRRVVSVGGQDHDARYAHGAV